MNEMTSISEMQKFHFGSKVLCSDGEEGILSHVCFAASARSLSYIGVRLVSSLLRRFICPLQLWYLLAERG